MTYVIDVDGTLCDAEVIEGIADYENARPIQPMIDKVNELFSLGHTITLFTARNMKTFEGDLKLINKHTRPVLEEWLMENKVHYGELIMGKPWGPDVVYVDDRMLTMEQFVSIRHTVEDIEIAFKENKEWI